MPVQALGAGDPVIPAASSPVPASPSAVAGEVRPAPGSMRIVDVVTASVLLALGCLVIVSSVRMGVGWGSDGPQSGFVPFWLSVVLVSSCAYIVVKAVRRGTGKAFAHRDQLRHVLAVLLPAAAMVALTRPLGLYVASVIYMAAYMRFGGRNSWAFSIALPVAFAVLMFFVFERWFLVPLPKGPLEAWLGY
jgi:hypothetical protein